MPVDLGSNIQATIHAYAYHNLKQALGLSTGRIEIMDTSIMAAKVEDAVRDALQIDAIQYVLQNAETIDDIDKHFDFSG